MIVPPPILGGNSSRFSPGFCRVPNAANRPPSRLDLPMIGMTQRGHSLDFQLVRKSRRTSV
jgi:hypothetical protein